MGSVMAPLPLKAGYSVIGFDPATTLDENRGVCVASRLEDLVSCDAIILMLPDGKTVANVATVSPMLDLWASYRYVIQPSKRHNRPR